MYPHEDRESPLLPGERWAPHPSLPVHVSTLGRVFRPSTGRFLGYPVHRGTARGRPQRDNRYIGLTIAGRRTYVHALVLETFVGPRPWDHDGDHIDHDRMNNRLDNLRWRLAALNRGDTWSASPLSPVPALALTA